MRAPIRAIVSFVALLGVLVVVLAAQDKSKLTDEQGKILALESIWNRAEQSKDVSALSHIFAPSMTYTDTDGSFRTREQFLEYVKNDPSPPDQLTTDDVAVQSFGDTAVVTGVFHGKWTKNGKPLTLKGRYTDTWIKINGIWQCVASQATLIQK